MKIKFTLTRTQFRTLFGLMTHLDAGLINHPDTAIMAHYLLSAALKKMFRRLDNPKDNLILQWNYAEAAAFRTAVQSQYEMLDIYERAIVDTMLLTIGMRLGK